MDPGVLGALRCADHRRRPSDPRGSYIVYQQTDYLATWRDSWQLIGEVKTRLGQSTVGSVASFTT